MLRIQLIVQVLLILNLQYQCLWGQLFHNYNNFYLLQQNGSTPQENLDLVKINETIYSGPQFSHLGDSTTLVVTTTNLPLPTTLLNQEEENNSNKSDNYANSPLAILNTQVQGSVKVQHSQESNDAPVKNQTETNDSANHLSEGDIQDKTLDYSKSNLPTNETKYDQDRSLESHSQTRNFQLNPISSPLIHDPKLNIIYVDHSNNTLFSSPQPDTQQIKQSLENVREQTLTASTQFKPTDNIVNYNTNSYPQHGYTTQGILSEEKSSVSNIEDTKVNSSVVTRMTVLESMLINNQNPIETSRTTHNTLTPFGDYDTGNETLQYDHPDLYRDVDYTDLNDLNNNDNNTNTFTTQAWRPKYLYSLGTQHLNLTTIFITDQTSEPITYLSSPYDTYSPFTPLQPNTTLNSDKTLFSNDTSVFSEPTNMETTDTTPSLISHNQTLNPTSQRICTDIFDAYNCTCPPGFDGPVCQNNINDCFPDACKNNGTCIDGINTFECECLPSFKGARCEIKIDPCENNKCSHGAQCVPQGPSNYTCDCDKIPNFFGDFCDIPTTFECTTGNICHNEGQCQPESHYLADEKKNVSFVCKCPPAFEGVLCEHRKDFCRNHKCVNGTCIPDENNISNNDNNNISDNYICKCHPGFQGQFCETDIDECAQSNSPNGLCQNGGICLNEIGNFSCHCPSGWSGRFCDLDINECEITGQNPCQNGGSCQNIPGGFKCDCQGTGFEGEFCDQDIDECAQPNTSECGENGRCVNTNGSFVCDCHTGYSGPKCEKANCSLIQCHNNGTCMIDELTNTWRCNCVQNSYGLFCENLSFCLYNPCVSGICYNKPNPMYGLNYTCECDANHIGPNCSDIGVCTKENNPCFIGGVCLNKPNMAFGLNFTCDCPPNRTEPLCEPIDHCLDNACVNGDCINQIDNYTCKCLPGYSGIHCSINTDECDPNPCQNGGKCFDEINSYRCICDGTGFGGRNCSEDLNECSPDKPNPCLNNGTCVNQVGGYKCDCLTGYLGEKCELINPCEPVNPCQHEGTCKAIFSNDFAVAECTCKDPFRGEFCQINPTAQALMSSRRKMTTIVAPIVCVLLAVAIVALIAFMISAKKKRATRGAYSPSKQEVTNSRVELEHVLKPPPEERLI